MLPRGSVPLNVETTLTAPDTMLPETETPFAPVSATFNVGSAVRTAPALPAPARPSAAANTIRQRNANACELFGRRAHRSSVSRSTSSSTTSARCAITAPILVDDEDDFDATQRDPAN